MNVDLSIIIVSWNVAPLLRDCLNAVYGASGVAPADGDVFSLGPYTVEVWVVDSASSDDSVEMVRREFPQVRLVASPHNLGFSRGNNLALRQYRGRYALLLNPDTRPVDDALVAMMAYMEGHPQVGVLGPQLRYGDGRLQSSRRRFPTLMTALMESTVPGQWFQDNRWARAYRLADTPDDAVQAVDWVVGACMLVRREAIDAAGLLDERFFMYSEELDWCRRIVAAGWAVVFYPPAVVIHYEGQSSGQVAAARAIRFESSKVLYFAKHHGRAAAGFLRAFLWCGYVWRWCAEAAKYVLGHRRAVRRQRMAAYGEVLRSGLRPPLPPVPEPEAP